jgi:hypothetical protein
MFIVSDVPCIEPDRQGCSTPLAAAFKLDSLERFRAKWIPVRVKKTRQNKNLEPRSDSIGTEKALADARQSRSAC